MADAPSSHDDARAGDGSVADRGGSVGSERGSERAPRPHPPTSEPAPFSQVVGRVVLAIVAILFVIFSFFNLQGVEFNWIFGTWQQAPLILLLLGSFILGAAIGAGWVWRRGRVRHAKWQREEAGRS